MEMQNLEQAVIMILQGRTLTQREVCDELYAKFNVNISLRYLRKIYTSIREKFARGEIDFTICHGEDGNYISTDSKVIRKDNADCRRTAFALLKNSYDRDRRLNLINQMTLEEYARLIIIEEFKNGGTNG